MGYRLLLLGLLITAVGYTVAARRIPMDAWTAAETVNAQTLPTVYGIVLSLALLALLALLAPNGGTVTLAGIMVAVHVAVDVANPMLYRDLFDDAIPNADRDYFLQFPWCRCVGCR